MIPEYLSVYGPLILQYFELKHSLGYLFAIEYRFRDFDRFLYEIHVTQIGLTRSICEIWSKRRPNEVESNRYKRINDIRNFSVFLNGIGYPSYVPQLNASYKTTFIPHIFTQDEIARFFEACDRLTVGKHSLSTQIYPAIFRLMYGCGLREMEALSIHCKDVDLIAKTVYIRTSKNGEERILPISESVTEVLSLYAIRYRQNADDDDLFFVRKDGDPCSPSTLYKIFRKILFAAHISHGGKGLGPRVHDFRHSFSVHTLAVMSDNNIDLYYSLPILSKYLGHKSIDATEKYVRLTADMYPGILADVNQVCAYIFPEVYDYASN